MNHQHCHRVILFMWMTMSCFAQEGIHPPVKSIGLLYEQWDSCFRDHPFLNEAFIQRTNTPFAKLNELVAEIDDRRMEMGLYLCDKASTNKTIEYFEALLLVEVFGMYWLIVPGQPRFTQDVKENLKVMSLMFSLEWDGGKYPAANDTVGAVCRDLLSKEDDEQTAISAMDLLPLRRYGVYAIPELMNQISLNNSRHAFAAMLIISKDREAYREYIEAPRAGFKTRTEKLEKARLAAKHFLGDGRESASLQRIRHVFDAVSKQE